MSHFHEGLRHARMLDRHSKHWATSSVQQIILTSRGAMAHWTDTCPCGQAPSSPAPLVPTQPHPSNVLPSVWGRWGGHQEEWSGHDLGGCPVRNGWCLSLPPPELQPWPPSSPAGQVPLLPKSSEVPACRGCLRVGGGERLCTKPSLICPVSFFFFF